MHALEIIGITAMVCILAVIVAHFLMPDDSSPAQVSEVQIKGWAAKAISHNYFQRLLCGFDQFMNVIFGGNLGETISARTSRYIRSKAPEFFLWKWAATWIIWLCDLVQAMHGVKAEAGDLVRAMTVVNAERTDLGLPPLDLLS